MTLQEKIKKDLVVAMKAKDEERKEAIRVIIGEFGRAAKKELSDDEVIKILKKLLKSEKDLLEKRGDEKDTEFIHTIEDYLPQMASDEEIRTWIEENIDFSNFKNKMQAMGSIMKHFGSAADGSRVKVILEGM
jgi:uncharacterized protein YqeY